MFNRFLTFGEQPVKEIVLILFCLGIVPLFISALYVGKIVSLSFFVETSMRYGGQAFIEREENKLLGFFAGILFLGIGIVLWKVVCELVLLIFRGLEVYIKKNDQVSEIKYSDS